MTGKPPRATGALVGTDILDGLAYYFATGLVVAIGLLFGTAHVRNRESGGRVAVPADLVAAGIRFDGHHYREVAQHGYEYDPAKRSTVAFFPAYPLVTRLLSSASGLRAEAALLLASNTSLAVAFVLLAVYVRARLEPTRPSATGWVLLAFGVWPGTFFFRMAYAESLFLCTALLTLIAIQRRWPLLVVAVIAGLATATRPVGVAVTASFLWHAVCSSQPRKTLRIRLGQAVLLAPVACWGLLAYMLYLHITFGNALAFAQTQQHWTMPPPVAPPTLAEKLSALVTLEPIRGVYDAQSPRYWSEPELPDNPLFSILFWNPILFLLAAGLVAYGAWSRWLNGPETVLGVFLLAVPYVTRAYEMSMASHARFAAAVVVIYPVLGRILASMPAPAACVAVSLSAVLMSYWTALYAAGYLFF